MDIKQKVREALLESSGHKRKYGCLMVFLSVENKDWKDLQSLIKEEDLYTEEEDSSYGREDEPHVTILYGLHDDIEDKDIEKDIKNIIEPKIEFKSISMFENEKFDVLKFDVKKGELDKLNKLFSEYPNTNSFPDYHPHCTIAYLKKGTGAKIIKEAKTFVNMNIVPNKLVYSKADKTKKSYKFKEKKEV